MKKRSKFKCWNCPRTYTLFREITDQQKLIVACPYCSADAIVDLTPFRKEKKAVLREGDTEQSLGYDFQLPEILPTQKPE